MVEEIQPGFEIHQRHYSLFHQTAQRPNLRSAPAKSALQNAPGVESAALAYPVPFSQGGLTSGFSIRNRQPEPGEPEWHGEAYFVTPEYFATLRIPIVAGRNFTVDRRRGRPRWSA